jgi:hypothetical protein
MFLIERGGIKSRLISYFYAIREGAASFQYLKEINENLLGRDSGNN